MPQRDGEVTTERLQAFADAWNRHDVDALMSFMSDDCAFEASAGPDYQLLIARSNAVPVGGAAGAGGRAGHRRRGQGGRG